MTRFLWLYLAVSFLALFAAGFMRGWGPALALLAGGLRSAWLACLGRGLGLRLGPRTAQAHAVMTGHCFGRPLRLQLGAGLFHAELGWAMELGSVPRDLEDSCLRRLALRHLPVEGIELGASGLRLILPIRTVLRLGTRLVLQELFASSIRVEAELGRPEALARMLDERSLAPSVRARVLEYRVARFPEAPGTTEIMERARTDPAPELRLAAAKLLGAAGGSTLLQLASEPERLSGRTQRALIDALLTCGTEQLRFALESISERARPRTLRYLLDAVRTRPESLVVARAVIRRRAIRHPNGVAARQSALALLAELHPDEDWKDSALEILSSATEPAALRQSAFEALVQAKARPAALEETRKIASSHGPLRGWAIGALAKHRGAKEADWLIDLARRDRSARLPVLLAIPDLQGRGEDWLLECLDSSSHLVLEQSLLNLASLGSLRALTKLRATQARLASETSSRALRSKVEHCIEAISNRHRGAGGLSGGLAVVSADDERGHLMLSPPIGSVSKPESTT